MSALNPPLCPGPYREAAFACLERVGCPQEACRRHRVFDRLSTPALRAEYPAEWLDDAGAVRLTRICLTLFGPEPPRLGLFLMRPDITPAETETLAFLEMLRACLLGGGGSVVWAAAIDPAALSDGESMGLCRAGVTGLARCLPALDGAALRWSMPRRERDYLSARLRTLYRRPADDDGYAPGAAAGYGLVRAARELLRRTGASAYGRVAAVYGTGATALSAAENGARLGMSVLRLDRFRPECAGADLHFFCDPRRPLDRESAGLIAPRRPLGVLEGALTACRPEAAEVLRRAGIPFLPAIAASAGAFLLPADGQGPDRWTAERRLRREMESLVDRIWAVSPGDPCTGAYAAAVTAGAEGLLRRGI